MSLLDDVTTQPLHAELLFEGSVTPAEAVVRALIAGGVDLVVGIPGGNASVIFDALYDHRDEVRTMLVREESIASVMAEVYAKQTGRPIALLAQGPWVVSNAGMGMLEALTASTPMVVLTDLTDGGMLSHHSSYQSGTGEYGNWDLGLALKGVTKLTTIAETAEQGVQAVQMAIKHSMAGQPGPVAVVFDSGALVGEVVADGLPRLYGTESYVRPDTRGAHGADVDAAARALVTSERPVIIAGNGVRMGRAAEPLLALAQAAGVPIVTTNGGKGVVSERHELALGLMGSFGLEAANRAVADADVVLAVGTKLGAVDTCGENPELLDPRRQLIFQIDKEPRNAPWTFPTHALIGDAAATLEQLIEAVVGMDGRPRSGVASPAGLGTFTTAASTSAAVPLLPQRVIHELSEGLPRDAVVTCDAGENRLFTAHHYRSGATNGFVQSAGIGGMGFAIPAALGAKLAEPERMAVAVCGDGGFSMTMNGLMTAVEEKLPIVVVVLNNQMLGWVKHDQGERVIAADFEEFDHGAIARSLGCRGSVVRTPDELVRRIAESVAERHMPTVIDVRISAEVSYRECISSFASRDWSVLV